MDKKIEKIMKYLKKQDKLEEDTMYFLVGIEVEELEENEFFEYCNGDKTPLPSETVFYVQDCLKVSYVPEYKEGNHGIVYVREDPKYADDDSYIISERKEIPRIDLDISYEFLRTTVCEDELYGDYVVTVNHHYKITVNDVYSFESSFSEELTENDDLYDLVVGHVCEELSSCKGNLVRAFEIMDFTEEECFMALCEDHQLEGVEVDIRSTFADNEDNEVYHYGREPHACMVSFIKQHFCDGLVEILAPTVYVSNAFSGQMVDSDCDVKIRHITKEEFDENKTTAVSYCGHKDTAEVVGIPFHRGFLSLKPGDLLYVAQLTNGRLPDGTTNLPENFIFKYMKYIVGEAADD